LREASGLGIDPVTLAEPALRLLQSLPDCPQADCVSTLAHLADRLGPAQDDLRLGLHVGAAVIDQSASGVRAATEAIESLLEGSFVARSESRRLALAHLAFTYLGAGRATATQVADLAMQAFDGGQILVKHTTAARLTSRALLALVSAGRFAVADGLARDAQTEAVHGGSTTAIAELSLVLAHSLFLQGALNDADAAVRSALSVANGEPWQSRPTAVGLLSYILIEQGRSTEAARLLAEPGAVEATPATLEAVLLAEHRARLLLAEGRFDAALEAVLAAGQWAEHWNLRNPALTSWRALASDALASSGDIEGARRMAAENLELAQSFGSPWAEGAALRVAAATVNGAERLDRLSQAVALLDTSGATLELARALIDLGAAQCQEDRRDAARTTLRRGADLAYRCGATRLADRAAKELRAAGARPRRLALTGSEALTPAERRVTELAAIGQSNSRIAEILFVTEKTVEGHLARAYQKLGIRSRRQLRPSEL
jgi:DNA-binding CsgD family transcriptional regulator